MTSLYYQCDSISIASLEKKNVLVAVMAGALPTPIAKCDTFCQDDIQSTAEEVFFEKCKAFHAMPLENRKFNCRKSHLVSCSMSTITVLLRVRYKGR